MSNLHALTATAPTTGAYFSGASSEWIGELVRVALPNGDTDYLRVTELRPGDILVGASEFTAGGILATTGMAYADPNDGQPTYQAVWVYRPGQPLVVEVAAGPLPIDSPEVSLTLSLPDQRVETALLYNAQRHGAQSPLARHTVATLIAPTLPQPRLVIGVGPSTRGLDCWGVFYNGQETGQNGRDFLHVVSMAAATARLTAKRWREVGQ